MKLNVIQIDQVGTDILGQFQTVALRCSEGIGATDGRIKNLFLPGASVEFLAKFNVGGKTARCDDDALLSCERHFLAVVFGLNADNTAALVFNQLFGSGISKDLHLFGIGPNEGLKPICVGKAAADSRRTVTARVKPADNGIDRRAEMNAFDFKPIHD